MAQILAYSLTCRYIYININININAESNGLNYGAAVPDKTGENKHRSVATMNNTINNLGPRDPGIEKAYILVCGRPTCAIPAGA